MNTRIVKLGSVCTVVSGSTPKSEVDEYWDGDVKWITPAELTEDSYIITDSVRHITSQAVHDTSLKPFPEGTVILSSRAPIGKTAIAGCEMYCNQGFKNLICSPQIDPKYLYCFLSGKTEYLNSLGRGATFKEISKSIVESIEIPLPELAVQRQISLQFEHIRALIRQYRKQLHYLDQLVKSRFIEMFGDPVRNDKGWPLAPLASLAEIKIGPFGSLLHKEDYVHGGHALVNPSHIIDGQIVTDNDLTVSEAKYAEMGAYHLRRGDIVLGRRGEMGRCAVVYNDGLLCGTGSLIIRPAAEMLPYFLQKIISYPTFKESIEDMAVGVTMMNLNVPIVSNFMIPLLPLEEQSAYLRFVEQTDKSKYSYEKEVAA